MTVYLEVDLRRHSHTDAVFKFNGRIRVANSGVPNVNICDDFKRIAYNPFFVVNSKSTHILRK